MECHLPNDFDRLVERLLTDAERRRLVVLIDGGSGSGKTTLAADLARHLTPKLPGLQSVSLEDFYPGWFGLMTASAMVSASVLASSEAGYRRWDWVADGPAEWIELDPQAPILVEGCGAITARSAALASTTIWVERPTAERKDLALARDEGLFDPWWDVWAEQEAEHWNLDRPQELADIIVYPQEPRP